MSFWKSIQVFFKGPPEEVESSNPFVRRGALWARLALRLSLASGIASILMYAFIQKAPFLRTPGLGLLLLCASFLVGGTLGFLFGIPRKLQQSPAPEKENAAPADGSAEDDEGEKAKESARSAYESNTSLEQISDWLTKILVGLTLTQWSDLRTGFQKMIQYMAPAFGTGSEVFVGGLVIVGALCGFFFGYLPTRLFLWLALTESDNKGAELQEARKNKNLQEVASVRNLTGGSPPPAATTSIDGDSGGGDSGEKVTRAAEVRQQIKSLAQKYETLRATLKPGPDRTRKLEAILSEMRMLTPQIDEAMRKDFQNSGSPGERLAAVAWLQVYPWADALQWLADRIGAEKPFIGYHAGVALLTAARDRNIPAQQVLEAVKRAQSFLEPSDAGTDRAKILAQAEQEVKARA